MFKKILSQLFILVALGFLILLSFSTLLPIVKPGKKVVETKFSAERAMTHVEKIAKKPHYIGSDYHSSVRNYIVNQLQDIGLTVHTQNAYVVNTNKVMTNPVNILARIPGTNPEPKSDLLVMAHYDSDPHAALGAADDAASVAAILEGLRVLQKDEFKPENNLIVCITDAEEIGLLGAQLFVEQHPWAENVGLVLNFEARGTSGPSNTILETNSGNRKLVNLYADARPNFPMASSLMYEIYKTLPNDTDATVFREEKDIPSFFFAFIDGHYNYHTAADKPENLDINSLAHQGSYFMSLVPAFANQDLSQLTDHHNEVFFNFPFFKLVHYDYQWIIPLLLLAWIGFFVLLIFGLRSKRLQAKSLLMGALPFLLSLVLSVAIAYWGWQWIMKIYPQYQEIQQGFPYNGHSYIFAFVLLGIGITFLCYHVFSRFKVNLWFFPLVVWLLICSYLAFAFKGGSFFIFPIFFFEAAVFLSFYKKYARSILLLIACIPAIFIFSPLVIYVPVALGLKMLYLGMALLILESVLILPVFRNFKRKDLLGYAALLGAVWFFVLANQEADFTEKHPKPNSLVYQLNIDEHKATWNTYDKILDDWTKPYFSERKNAENSTSMSSKYGGGFTYSQEAEVYPIPEIEVEVKRENAAQDSVSYQIKLFSERKLNRMNIYLSDAEKINRYKVNDILIRNTAASSKIKRGGVDEDKRLLTYYPTSQDTLYLNFTLPENDFPQLKIQAATNNLLDNEWIKVAPRNKNMMPRPFVLNDAILTIQTVDL